jgi:hypothetical protein
VAPRPVCVTLADHIDRFDEDFVNCYGYEIVHLVNREGPFDPSEESSSSVATGSPTMPTASRRLRWITLDTAAD